MTTTIKAGTARKPTKTTATKTTATKTTSAEKAKPSKTAKPVAKQEPGVAKAPARRPRQSAKVDPEVRRHYVEVAAYYIAERRGFLGGCANEDWVQAELEIDRLLAEKKLSA